MNNKNNSKNNCLNWLEEVNGLFSNEDGYFYLEGFFDDQIFFICEKVNPKSNRLNQIIADASKILSQTYASMELEFARKYPDAVSEQKFLRPVEALFKNGINNVDWILAEKILHDSMRIFFTTTDFTVYSGENDFQLFVTAIEKKTGNKLGVIQFTITPEFDHGNVRIGFFGASEDAKKYKTEEQLLASILEVLVPHRVFLHTRITNEGLIKTLIDFGFVKFEPKNKIKYWQDLEHIIGESK